jgi:hypothetical protein
MDANLDDRAEGQGAAMFNDARHCLVFFIAAMGPDLASGE